MENKRHLVSIVEDIAKDHQLDLEKISYDWILKLSNHDRSTSIFGYNFEINSATSYMLANDKSATYHQLTSSNIPAVEHRLFLNPIAKNNIAVYENRQDAIDYFYENNQKIVCKPSSGTAGNGIHIATSFIELESIFNLFFSKEISICLSPFYHIIKEYRVVVLDHHIKLIYSKELPFVLGNGSASILTLIQKKFSQKDQKKIISSMSPHTISKLTDILPHKECFTLTWKSNLCKGAKPILIKKNHPLATTLIELAQKTSKALGIRFFSVDIIETKHHLKVLEVNSGVMMEEFLNHYPQKRHFVYSIYEESIIKMMYTS